jgi:orotate phosphoribosyltransferase
MVGSTSHPLKMRSDLFLKSEKAADVSRWLMDIGAITCRIDPPYVFTSGWRSPVYVNCRKIISSVEARTFILQIALSELRANVDLSKIDCIAGGETAGIPYAAWISDALGKPMIYIRKKQKEFGLQEHIVGELPEGATSLLVEDLNTDGASKLHFASVIRSNGGFVRTVFCVFNYAVFPGTEANFDNAGLDLIHLTDWPTTIELGIKTGYFASQEVDELRRYLSDPVKWSQKKSA